MKGKLYVIGIGPGDPELLTLKAVRIIKGSPVLCVPKGREEGSSLALSIAEKAVDLKGKEIIEAHFPMRKTTGEEGMKAGSDEGRKAGRQEVRKARSEEREISSASIAPCLHHSMPPSLSSKWNTTVDAILSRITAGKDVAFLTLGDPAIYSTFFYLYDRLLEACPDLDIEIIPGVSSINASAARARIYLGLADDRIAVLPANYMGQLSSVLESFDTVVLMKVSKVFHEIVSLLAEAGLAGKAVYVARAGMEDEKIITDIRDVRQDELNYFSMVIVKK